MFDITVYSKKVRTVEISEMSEGSVLIIFRDREDEFTSSSLQIFLKKEQVDELFRLLSERRQE